MRNIITLVSSLFLSLILTTNVFAVENTTPEFGNVHQSGFGNAPYGYPYILGDDKQIYELVDGSLVPVDNRLTNVHKFTQTDFNYYGINVLKDDGTVWKWEEENYNNEQYKPAKGLTKKVIDISRTLAVYENGTVAGFHFSEFSNHEAPLIEGLYDVVQIRETDDNILALKKDGTVWTWGPNQLERIEELTDIVEIRARLFDALALRKDGTVWAWDIAERFNNNGDTVTTKPIMVQGLSNIVKISDVGTKFAIDSNGDVWAWGDNEFGQLGNGKLNYKWLSYHDPMFYGTRTFYTSEPTSIPVKVNGISNVLDITAVGGKVIALTKNGEIWQWGNQSESSYFVYKEDYNEELSNEYVSQLDIQFTPTYETKFSKWKPFTDVPTNYWGIEAITWAKEKGLVNGKGNNRFDPDGTLTEAEFITMLIRLFDIEVPESNGHWAQGRYDALASYNLPLNGYKTSQAKDEMITRGLVARVIAASQGKPSDFNSSIQWMYDEKLTTGKYTTGDKFKDYAPYDKLTRAEAATFMKNIYGKGVTTFK